MAVVLGLAGCGDDVDCEEFEFNSQAWRASSDDPDLEPDGERHDVAAALVDCRTLIGKSQSEVRRLLGPPLEGDRESELHYVGPDSLQLDDEGLVVTFDARGRVVETELVSA